MSMLDAVLSELNESARPLEWGEVVSRFAGVDIDVSGEPVERRPWLTRAAEASRGSPRLSLREHLMDPLHAVDVRAS